MASDITMPDETFEDLADLIMDELGAWDYCYHNRELMLSSVKRWLQRDGIAALAGDETIAVAVQAAYMERALMGDPQPWEVES